MLPRLLPTVALAASPILGARPNGEKYNVLYFVADDFRPEMMAAYGQTQMLTPNLDKLAKGGLVFNTAYCQQAVCGPSRASFMTGRRPHHTLVFDNNADFRKDGIDADGKPGSEWTTMPEFFKKSGYTTLGGGKTFHPKHPKDFDEPTSWSQDMDYFPFSYYEKNPAYDGPCPSNISGKKGGSGASEIDTWCRLDEPDENFYDRTLASNTIKQLKYAGGLYKDQGKNFFVMAGFARPHAPWRVPARVWDKYNDVEMPVAKRQLPPNNMPGIAWHQQGFYNSTDNTLYVPNITHPIEQSVQRAMRQAYYAAVSWMDEQIGRVLDKLEALNLADSTVVLIHGDHGWQLGEHNSWHKETNFELGTRVPLVMRAPFRPNSVGKTTEVFAELVDVFPTLAELTGAGTPSDALDGTSLAPVFINPSRSVVPNNKGTLNKTVAYSQFPHDDMFDCPYYRFGMCTVNESLSKSDEQYYMGYSVRTEGLRGTFWYPWNKTHTKWDSNDTYVELYDHSTDTGANFDEMDIANLAFDEDRAENVTALRKIARYFFKDFAPVPSVN